MNLQDWQLERQLSVLAVSGGLDSMVLLHVFKELNFPCVVAHVNFGLRGNESDGDTQLVVQTCNKLGISCFVKHIDTEKYATENNLSIQMAARNIRYDFFQEIFEGQNAKYIATAHHQDDELENFFIYLLRNQLHTAWQGIPLERNNIIRPLLNISRITIQAYARNCDISFREDSSNASTKYLRNKIRHFLIPELKNEYASIAVDFQFISQMARAETKSKSMIYQSNWKSQVLETSDLSGNSIEEIFIPSAFLKNVENHFGLKNQFLIWGFSNSQADEIISRYIKVGKHWKSKIYIIYANRNGLTVKKTTKVDLVDVTIELNNIVHFGNFVIRMIEIKSSQVNYAEPNCYYFNSILKFEKLILRSWKVGDKMKPLGMNGSKKLSDIFIDKKINNDVKSDFPLLIFNHEILAIIGIKRSAEFLLDDSETAIKISWDSLN